MVSMPPPVPSKKGKKGHDSSMRTSFPMDPRLQCWMRSLIEDELLESEQEVDELHIFIGSFNNNNNLNILFSSKLVYVRDETT
jgi:hypothetical protein